MSYSGTICRMMKSPQGVIKWDPSTVCCSKENEIFVVNDGDPKAVYRYTVDDNECLGCVITGLNNPGGIAISEDGQQLFVTEREQSVVKIFQRQQ